MVYDQTQMEARKSGLFGEKIMRIERTTVDRIRVSFEGTVEEMQSMGETLRLLVEAAQAEKKIFFLGRSDENIQRLFSAFAVTQKEDKVPLRTMRDKVLDYIETNQDLLFSPRVIAMKLFFRDQDVAELMKDLTQEGILKEHVFKDTEGFFGYTWIPPEERENVGDKLQEHNGQQCCKGRRPPD